MIKASTIHNRTKSISVSLSLNQNVLHQNRSWQRIRIKEPQSSSFLFRIILGKNNTEICSIMESTPNEVMNDNDENKIIKEADNLKRPGMNVTEVLKPVSSSPVHMVGRKDGGKISQDVTPREVDSSGEVNMEASITTDDVMRAGGFGARDDISSFLPAASDSTDFESSILDAREYEEPQGQISRPGLGWTEATETK